jgi:hypothetical protein
MSMADWKHFWLTLVQLDTTASPGGGKVTLSLATTQGASLRRVSLVSDGYNPIDPKLDRIHLSQVARAELVDLCRPGGAAQELCAALLPLGRRLRIEHPTLVDFTWRWSPVAGTWSAHYRNERSVAQFVWSAATLFKPGQASLHFGLFEADGSFALCVLGSAFEHHDATASGKVFSGNTTELLAGISVRLGFGQFDRIPAGWKSRLRVDLAAVRSTVAACEGIRHR